MYVSRVVSGWVGGVVYVSHVVSGWEVLCISAV